ncbi:hypothetical protein E2C01_001383 [Portunus trituberculatus]|uniref:Uncharacterized protein n=1 Tax=Portunus trituberculatus TaxID=210409 RepID=A0A5B7CJ53_PORTR|nr:hypothetical protein [Portunus trituberculatus]
MSGKRRTLRESGTGTTMGCKRRVSCSGRDLTSTVSSSTSSPRSMWLRRWSVMGNRRQGKGPHSRLIHTLRLSRCCTKELSMKNLWGKTNAVTGGGDDDDGDSRIIAGLAAVTLSRDSEPQPGRGRHTGGEGRQPHLIQLPLCQITTPWR